MKKSFYLISFILIISFIVNKPSKAYLDKFVTIGTGNITGIYYPAGAAICKIVNKFKSDHFIRCAAEVTSGSAYNLKALNEQIINVAIMQSDLQYFAYNGKELYKDKPNKNLRSLFSLHTDALTIVTRSDSNITKFEDIRGRRISIGVLGSGSRSLIETLFTLYKWTHADFASVLELKESEQAEALCNNKIDVMIYNVGHPNGAVQEAVSSCETRIIPVEGEKIDTFLDAHPYYVNTLIPGGIYAGNPTSIKTFGVKSSLVVLDSLEDKIAYNFVKSVFDNIDFFKTLHPIFNNLNVKEMLTQGNIAPIHSGAQKYFQEKNIYYNQG